MAATIAAASCTDRHKRNEEGAERQRSAPSSCQNVRRSGHQLGKQVRIDIAAGEHDDDVLALRRRCGRPATRQDRPRRPARPPASVPDRHRPPPRRLPRPTRVTPFASSLLLIAKVSLARDQGHQRIADGAARGAACGLAVAGASAKGRGRRRPWARPRMICGLRITRLHRQSRRRRSARRPRPAPPRCRA